MFAKTLELAGHTRKFRITPLGTRGWEVRDEHDEHVLRRTVYTDWHRVERAVNMFNILIDDLEDRGWVSPGAPTPVTR